MSGELPALVVSLQHEVRIHSHLILFLLCPLLILVGAILPPARGRPYRVAGLVALGVGTASLFFVLPCAGPVSSSGANAGFGAVHWICRSLIMEARIIFIGLTILYSAVLLVPEVLWLRDSRLFSTVLPLSFLVLYMAGVVFVVQTTDSGVAVASTWRGADGRCYVETQPGAGCGTEVTCPEDGSASCENPAVVP